MEQKTSSPWQNFIKKLKQSKWFSYGKRLLEIFWENLQEFNKNYPNTSQSIQICFIYFFAMIDLIFAVLQNVISLGFVPVTLDPFLGTIRSILTNPILMIWASPEKVFFLSYLVIELMIVRKELGFSKLVRYNVLLIFALLMIQGLVISYWDLFFHRQITTSASQWIFGDGMFIYTDRYLGFCFFFFTFIVFTYIYSYLLWKALQGKLSTLPIKGLEIITDSVAFWLRIKTPTMRYGKKKKKDDDE